MIKLIHVVVFFVACSGVNQDFGQSIDADKLLKLQSEGAIIVDVRTKNEFDEGHISDVEHIDFYQPKFIESMEILGKDTPIVIHCAKGGRSGKAVKQLQEAGFKQVYDYSGGFTDWKSKGYPIVR